MSTVVLRGGILDCCITFLVSELGEDITDGEVFGASRIFPQDESIIRACVGCLGGITIYALYSKNGRAGLKSIL